MRRRRLRALLTVVVAVVVAAPLAFAGASDVDNSGPPDSVIFVDAWTNDDGTVNDTDIGDSGAVSVGFDLWPVGFSSDDPTAPGPTPPRLIDDAAICMAAIRPADLHSVDIEIDNAYPQYVCTITVVVENRGSVPASLSTAIITADPGLEVSDTMSPTPPAFLEPGAMAIASYSVRILNDADQSSTLGFTISTSVSDPPC